MTIPSIQFNLPLPRFSLRPGRPDPSLRWLLILATFASIISTAVFYHLNLIVAYNDARAHLNMARLAIDNLKPGFSQIGSVWLPLNHLLDLTLIWNDWLWHTGLAGAIFSMISYVLATLVIFRLTSLVIKDRLSVWLGTLVFATNLNILYMQSTPMTELLLLLFFASASYFFYRWVKSQKLNDLLLTALSIFFATLTRYDGWFLLIVIAALVIITSAVKLIPSKIVHSRLFNRVIYAWRHRSTVEGHFILFSTLAGFGVFLWVIWNWLIFKDPFYFAFGPYSAHAQQERIRAAGSLPTIFNLPLSLSAYWWAMVNNVGFLILIFSLVGLTLYALKNRFSLKALAIYTLWIPLVFHIVSLYLGHSILILPEMGVHITEEARTSWFNVRYGLMVMPAVAFFSAYLASRDLLAKIVLSALIIIQPLLFLSSHNIITITDGVQGTSSLAVGDVAEYLEQHAASPDELILTSISFNNALAFTAGLPLKKYIHEGTGKYWETSLSDPAIYATWIVMANGDVGDPVYSALVNEHHSAFLKSFSLVTQFQHHNIYQKRNLPQGFVYLENQEFNTDGSPYRFVGVNSYDLIYKTPEEIQETLSSAKAAGVSVVRFWVFGEGFPGALQAKAGVYDDYRLDSLDHILTIAKQENLKLILTLGNYWEDYGGIAQYLKWANLPSTTPADLDRFYTSPQTRQLYQNHLDSIVGRTNQVSHLAYAKDPTIFAWELLNEPRSATHATSSQTTMWISEMSNYLKNLDHNHLILAGSEGFLPGSPYTSTHTGPWASEVGPLANLSAITGHYYLQDYPVDSSYEHPVVLNWKSYADSIHKPLIIEEVGFSKNPRDNQGIDRLLLYTNLFKEVEDHDIQGVILWNWSLDIDTSFGISPADPRDQGLIDLIKSSSAQISKE